MINANPLIMLAFYATSLVTLDAFYAVPCIRMLVYYSSQLVNSILYNPIDYTDICQRIVLSGILCNYAYAYELH